MLDGTPRTASLEPLSDAGVEITAIAAGLVDVLADRAPKYDRSGSFPFENFADLHEAGILRATVPGELGGGDVELLHDLTVCVNRIAWGDASTAIAVNMHLSAVWAFAREWRQRRASGAPGEAEALGGVLERVANEGMTIAVLGSERGASFLESRTEAIPVEGGWRISGQKTFGTLSPVAELFVVSVRLRRPEACDRLAFAFVPRGTPGLEVLDNWDALGMRASGSNDVVLEDCLVPAPLVFDLGPWGAWNISTLERRAAGNLGLLGAFLGTAEEAARLAIAQGLSRPDPRRHAARRQAVGRMEVDLACARAVLERAARTFDRRFAEDPPDSSLENAHAAMKEFQCAKWVVNRSAVKVVDQAMTLLGGRAYSWNHPLSRLYRDVRAGPFMQPFSPLEALDYVGAVTLGEPDAGT